MKKQILIAASLLLFPALFIACKSNLTKDEAKKQIDEYTNAKKPATFMVPFAYQSYDFDEAGKINLKALEEAKKAEYIDYIIQNQGNILILPRIDLHEKVQFFLDKKDYSDFFFKAGTWSSEISSMAEPAPDAEGKIVCNVEYKVNLIPNEMLKAFSIIPNNSFGRVPPSSLTPGWGYMTEGMTFKGRFFKMQDGWKLEERE